MKVSSISALVLAVLGILVFPVMANAEEVKVLRGSEITESAIIDALAPGGLARSFKLADDQLKSQSNKPASTSLLFTFKSNSAELAYDAQQELDRVGRALNMDRLAEFKFTIEGHADKSGSYQLNQRLSKARAESVMSYLVYKHAIDPSRLTAIGKSYTELLNKEDPLSPENRRVKIVRIDASGKKQ
jgi:outer membrane protein OmpA-like peptidoglycan-associated protein